jgi:hypothetical protein
VLDRHRASWFGRIAFEVDTVIFHAFGKKKAAIVQCAGADCERASRLRRALTQQSPTDHGPPVLISL